jgi:periplasmic divalent cation tolerance protein
MEYRSVYITAKEIEEARRIGRVLVDEKLAACANYFPISSIYWWKGQMEEADETAIIVKTRAGLVDGLIKRVKELHSYKVPCVVSWIIEKGNPDYLEWIRESTIGEKESSR